MLRTVAHFANPYLPLTTTWIYGQIVHLRRYRPIVLTQCIQHLDQFPVTPIYSAERFPFPKRVIHRILRKVSDRYPFCVDILKRERVDVLHAHFGQEGCRALLAKRRTGLPMVTTFYGLDASLLPSDPYWQRRFRELFSLGELFLAEGSALRERLMALGCPEEKAVVQHLGVDLDRIRYRVRMPREDATFLVCASFREKKGVRYAVEAFGRICGRYPTARLRIIGDGPLRGEIVQKIRDLDLGDRVDVLGVQPYERFLEEVSTCDILLQPSVTASDGDTEGGAPVVLIEAQAAGMPVVATHHADIPEVVRDGVSGFLVPERDVEALAERMVYLLGHPEAWEKMGRAGRGHVEQEYDVRVQVSKLEDVYDSVR